MVRYSTNPVKIVTDENRVIGILCMQMVLKEADASGRGRPVPIPGSESVIPADTVIIAAGQAVDYEGIDVHKRDNKWIEVNSQRMTSMDRVFAGGDAVLGLETVSAAIGQGMHAAYAIEDYIKEHPKNSLASPPGVYSKDLNTYYY